MVNGQISEDLSAGLEQAATRAGRTKDDLLHEVIACHLEEDTAGDFELTEVQFAKLTRGIAQLDRGEVVPGEVVMAKLDALITELESR